MVDLEPVGCVQSATVQFVAQPQEVDLPDGLTVDQPRCPTGLGHALDLDPAAAAHRDVDILAAGAHSDADVAGGSAHPADEEDRLLDLFRRPEVGAGHRFDQRHAEPIGAPDDEVTAVGNLAARVLLDADLGDGELAAAERQAAVDADDGGALKSGRDRPVEVLLAGDVDLVDDVAAQHQTLFDGDVDRLRIDQKRRRVVHLVGADVGRVEEVDDVLAGLELHQCSAVVLAELRQGRSHVTEDRTVVDPGIESCRALAEHLFLGQQLLVNLEADPEPNLVVVDRLVQVLPSAEGGRC